MQQQSNDPSAPTVPTPMAWLLLRDGHAVPITGLAPDDLKTSRRASIEAPEAPLRHRRGLDAIVDRLGFRGDFGDYTHEHWRAVQTFLRDHRCGPQRNLFSSHDLDVAPFFFGPTFGPTRRQLADRVFVSGRPAPSRVFLGVDVDWRDWDDRASAPMQSLRLPEGAARAATASPEQVLIANRHDLIGQWGFLDDKLIAGDVRELLDITYQATPRTQAELDDRAAQIGAIVRAFRAVFPEHGPGWVDVLRFDPPRPPLPVHARATIHVPYSSEPMPGPTLPRTSPPAAPMALGRWWGIARVLIVCVLAAVLGAAIALGIATAIVRDSTPTPSSASSVEPVVTAITGSTIDGGGL